MKKYALLLFCIASTTPNAFGVQFINLKDVPVSVAVYQKKGIHWEAVTGFTLLAKAKKYGSHKQIVAGQQYKVTYNNQSEEFTESLVYDKAHNSWTHVEIYVK